MDRADRERLRTLAEEIVDLRFVIRGMLRHMLNDEQRRVIRDDLCGILEGMYQRPITETGHRDLQASLARIEKLFQGAPSPDDTN